ncbi:MEDS domain-containing protein [Pseudonocardia nematodicida]|uniref:MEDS domain-containing protein n=1 Tax=Pseudonocardia nematodicida TaxID=1206997 RepID=UPI0032C48C92
MTPERADPSSHVLAVPVGDEQMCEMVSQFLAGGLAAGERVSYFDDDTADAVLARLCDDGVDVTEPLRTGQFQLVPQEFTRAALLAPMDELGGVLEHNMQSAIDDGWNGLRFTGQMNHGLTREGGQRLDEYDQVLDDAMRGRPVHGLCIYDHARYPDDLIATMRRLHAVEIESPPVYDDSLLRITESAPDRIRLAGEVDHVNRPLMRRVIGRYLDRIARGDVDNDVLSVDLASLRFCDVASAVSVVHAAEELPVTLRLRLDNVRPGIARLLDRCGAAFAPQLEMKVRDRTALCTADALALAAGGAG